MTRPTWINLKEVERQLRAMDARASQAAMRQAATEDDRALVQAQMRLSEAKLCANLVIAQWHNEQVAPVIRAQALAAFIAILMRSFAQNCPDGAQALFGFLEHYARTDPARSDECVVEAAAVRPTEGGSA